MIAAVTNFYNPVGRQTKWKNFLKFREGIKGLPLYIIEAAFGDEPFVLPKDDKTIQVRCRDIIWQQYRLVNLVIQNLPDKFDKAVWVDADILFCDPNWHHELEDMLDDYKAVQAYKTVEFLDRDGLHLEEKLSVTEKAYRNSLRPEFDQLSSYLNMESCYATGFTWGVQREVIEKFGVYDYWITGSSDNAFILGIWGDWQNEFIRTRLNAKMKAHYMEWAKPFHEYMSASVHYLDTKIQHLWHGHRNYKKRWNALKKFDPYTDIGIADNGVFEWTSENPSLHEACRTMCCNYDMEFKPYL